MFDSNYFIERHENRRDGSLHGLRLISFDGHFIVIDFDDIRYKTVGDGQVFIHENVFF